MSNRVIFWGAGGQAKVLYECISSSEMKVAAVFDNNHKLTPPFPDIPLFYGKSGFRQWYTRQTEKNIYFLVAIGGQRGKERLTIQHYLQEQKLTPIVAIHPSAFVAENTVIGDGSQILAQSAVSTDTSIGRGCIINTGAIVDHECSIDDGVHICPGATVAGCVTIGKYAMIGTGAVVLPRIKIHEGAIIGAGSTVIGDVPPYTVVAGTPARIIREVKL